MLKKAVDLMPKALRDFLGLSFYFWSNENSGGGLEPIHIHVSKGTPNANSTKIWLRKNGDVELCHNNGQLSNKELTRSLEYIKANWNAIVAEWYRYFGI
jgi:hypothetical protein